MHDDMDILRFLFVPEATEGKTGTVNGSGLVGGSQFMLLWMVKGGPAVNKIVLFGFVGHFSIANNRPG